jgi:hypothetical protein
VRVLAAIIANLQNQEQPQPEPRPFRWQSRSAGRSNRDGDQSWPNYEIVDIIAALAAFQEIPGEHPGARAARRHRWIGEALPGISEARKKREAATFLMGAALAEAAAKDQHAEEQRATKERHASEMKLLAELKIEQIVEIIDSVRGPAASTALAAPVAPARGVRASGAGIGAGLLIGGLGGLLIGMALTKQRRRRSARW